MSPVCQDRFFGVSLPVGREREAVRNVRSGATRGWRGRRRTWRGSWSGSAGWPRRGAMPSSSPMPAHSANGPARPSARRAGGSTSGAGTGRSSRCRPRSPARSASSPTTSSSVSPIPTISPDLVVRPAALARASTDRLRAYPAEGRTARCSRATVSMLWLSTSGRTANSTSSEACVAPHVGDQRLDPRAGPPRADRLDARRHVGHPAVGEVVAGDHRQHGVVETHPGRWPRRRAPARRLPAPPACGCRRGRTRTPACSARRAP